MTRLFPSFHFHLHLASYLSPTPAATLRLRLKDELPHILIIRHIAIDGLADLLRGFLAVFLDPFFVPLFFCFDLSSLFVCMLLVVYWG